MNYDVVFHVDKTDGSLQLGLHNAVNYANALTGETFSMVMVVNAVAVTHLVAEAYPNIKQPLAKARDAGLKVCVCRNALNATGTDPEKLFPGCEIVPAGVVEVVRLQRQGYAYIKP